MTNRERDRYESVKLVYYAMMKFYPFTLDNLNGEEWRDIEDYEGLYQVSNFGRIKSFQKGERILKPACDKDGYLYLGLKLNGVNKNFKIHRLVAVAFIPNPEKKHQINHRDGNKLNNHTSNLEWVTHIENIQHATQTGLMPLGEERFGAKLTNEQVIYIRENPNNLSIAELADMFHVKESKISAVQLGKRYTSVGGSIREARKSRLKISYAVRNEIRAEYISGDLQFGAHALGKKYGVSPATIIRIIHEND